MKNYWKIITYMINSSKLLLFCAFIVLGISLLCEMMIPIGMSRFITTMEQNPESNIFFVGVLCFACAYTIICFVTAINTKLYMKIGSNLLWSMREKIYYSLWESDYFGYVQNNKNKFSYVLSDQTYTAFAIAVIYSISGLTNLVTVVLFIVIVISINFTSGVVLIFSIFITLLVSFVTGRKVLNGFELCNRYQEMDTSSIFETVNLVEATRTNGLQQYYLEKNKKIHNEFMKVSENAESKSSFCEAVENALHAMIYIVIAGVLMNKKGTSGSDLVTVLFLSNITLDVSQRVQRQIQVIIKNIPVFTNVIELIEIPLLHGEKLTSVNTILIEKLGLLLH